MPTEAITPLDFPIRQAAKLNALFAEKLDLTGGVITGNLEVDGGSFIFNESGGDFDFRVEGDTLTHLLFVDAGNDSVHIANSLLTGSATGDLVMANNNWLRWINAAGTTSTNFGIRGNANDDIIYSVPAAGDKHKFRGASTGMLNVVLENGGGGIEIPAESSADHTAPATNGCTLYLKDNGAGKTQLMAIFATGGAQQVAIQP